MNADAIIQAAEAGLEVKRKGYRDEIETLQKTLADEEAEIAGISESNKAVLSKTSGTLAQEISQRGSSGFLRGDAAPSLSVCPALETCST